MAIDPKSINRFLDYAEPPHVIKGADQAWLLRKIEAWSGVPFAPKTRPHNHQVEAVALAIARGRALLFLEMRLGKTKCALDYAQHLRRSGAWRGKGMIVVPSPILLDVWENETRKHSDLTIRAVRTDVDEFADALDSACDLIVMAWSGIQSLFSYKKFVTKTIKGVQKEVTKLAADVATLRAIAPIFSLAIIDELHTVKNHDSLRFEMGVELLRDCAFKLGLTGTPIGRNPFDLWAQVYLIDGGKALGNNYYFFQHAFGKKKRSHFAPGGFEIVFNDEKMPQLHAKLAPIALSYRLAECRTLPEICRGVVELRMLPEQRKLYLETIDGLIKSGETSDQRAVANVFIRLRQISSGFVPFIDENGEEHLHAFANAKLEWLEEFLAERPSGAHITIFHEFTETGRRICMLLLKLKIAHSWLYGGSKDKRAALESYRSGKVDVLVANTASGGVGVDLQITDYQLFFESPVSPIVRAQAEARALGPARGTRALMLDDLIVSPVEKKILEYITEGKDLLEHVVYNPRAWRELRERA